jgi:muramoyltetrapeptide carboxypeptidase LdcA involved in peptidoglycan recycling
MIKPIQMIKPRKLKKGDKIATISLSWGGAGELPDRYHTGKRQLEETFGVEVVETRNALKPAAWIDKNPRARADDLLEAFADPSIKAIFTNIGGEDSLRTLPWIDLDVIRDNPKIFLGFSDSTVTHFCCYKAGLTSYYGTSMLVGFAENGGIHGYQQRDLNKTLFSNETIGRIWPNDEGWTSERLEWADPENQKIKRKLIESSGWRFLQGEGIVEGELLGGCLEVLEFLKDTAYWVSAEGWKGKILFIEISEAGMKPANFRWVIRNYAASGIMKNLHGLIVGRPYNNTYWKEYDDALIKVIREEEGLYKLPIITGMDFGHTCPVFTIPYGVRAQIDGINRSFSIVENGVS